MINNTSYALSISTDIATKIIPNSKIVLFGSRARRDNSSDSDYDFLVITNETIDVRIKRALKSQMRKELALQKIPADILFQSEKEISSKCEITSHILKQVMKEGVLI